MPKQFHRYHIIQDLAKKYSHSTYLAAPINDPEHQVVLTVFSSSLLSSLHERQALLKRAQALIKLHHPHLLPILDLGIVEKQPFVVCEYVPHQSLRSHLKQLAPERFQLQQVLTLLLQVGEALAYAHSHQIVHGNLKPENILLDAHGHALLTDFSLLNRKDAIIRDQTTEEYAFCYLAPEQLAGTWDTSADQYALGCLSYELITGEVPFATKSLTSLIKDQSYYVQPAPLSDKVPDLPASLEAAVLKALAQNPSDRFGDFLLFLEVIRTAASPPPAFPLRRSQTADEQQPHSLSGQPTKQPSFWASPHEDAVSAHPLSHRVRASSGAVVDNNIIEESDVKDLFAEIQQADDLGAGGLVSEEEASEMAFAHDQITDVWPTDIDDTSGQTRGDSRLVLQPMQSSSHSLARKRPRIKGHLIRMVLLTGIILFLIFSAPSLGLLSVVKTWGQTPTFPVPTKQGQQSTGPGQTLQTTYQLIPTVVLDLPPHSASPAASASSASIPSQSEPVVNPSSTPAQSSSPTTTPTVLSPSPSGYWTFDEGSGSTAHDSSGNSYTGTLQGNASWAKGKIGPYALSLDGSSGTYVDIPTAVVDTTKSYTFAAWVLLTNNSTGKVYTAISIDGNQISGQYLGFSNYYFCLRTTSADSTSPNNWYTACTSYTPNTNQWYHLAGVYNAAAQTISLYVNGSLVQKTADPSPWKASGHTLIGRDKWSSDPVQFWPGLIDDVRIYQTALSASEIQALVNSGG